MLGRALRDAAAAAVQQLRRCAVCVRCASRLRWPPGAEEPPQQRPSHAAISALGSNWWQQHRSWAFSDPFAGKHVRERPSSGGQNRKGK